jgi:hypothetical protein
VQRSRGRWYMEGMVYGRDGKEIRDKEEEIKA